MSDPRVSIGLPVYNGEQFLVEAIQTILDQTFEDFELIISDNASTDGTEEICRMFEKMDSRVRYIRHEINLGAAANFNTVFENATGEYFKWAACDDACKPEFIEKCVAVLDGDSSVVLSYTQSEDIDDKSEFICTRDFRLCGGLADPSQRFRYEICSNHWCYHIFGVLRSDVLRETRLIDKYVASDRVLLAHLALLGRFEEVPESLFRHRQHDGRSTKTIPTLHERAGWFDSKAEGALVFPSWRLLREYAGIIGRSSLTSQGQFRCYFQLIRWLGINWRKLLQDIGYAVRYYRYR